ncbi:MAG: MotA/TolQ/ExbB proton channel family protein [Clostridia bacterium]|nr:MotA/TolQ/ExbB proton channel family protein [Clostridia bacterium]
MEFIQKMFPDLITGAVNLLVYIAIVAIFIVGIFKCILPVIHTRSLLRKAIRSIKSEGNNKYAWQEDNFLGKGTLFPHWSEYLNNLFFADGVYHNASNVEDYINEDTVMYGPGHVSFADAIPGLLTSIGFLGTLIGLAQGLAGFDMRDSAAVQQSIVTLIPGMKYAFTTSIVGVVGSVAFTLITRWIYGSSEHTLKTFYSAMSRHAGVLSVDPMTQIAIYQQEQTALIQTMSKDLNGAFTENMANAIHAAVEPLHQTLKSFVNVTSKEQARFIDAVMMRFADRMDESINGQLRRFAQILDETSRLQAESCDAVRSALAGSSEALSDIREIQNIAASLLENSAAYVEQLKASQIQTDEAYVRMTGNIEQLELVSRQQSNYLKTVSSMQADVVRSVDTMTTAVTNFTRRFAEENASASAAMLQAAGELRASGQHIENIHLQAAKALESELASTLDAYREYVNQFTQRVDYLASGISESLKQMPGAVSDSSDRFLDQVDHLTDTLEQARRGLDEAVSRLYRR